MKLACADLQTTFNEDMFNVIVAEDVKTFRKLCDGIGNSVNGADCGFVLSDGDKELDLSRCGLFVSDPLDLKFCDKKLANRLVSELSGIAEEKYGAEIDEILSAFSRLFDKLNGESAVEIDWFDESPIAALFKAFGVAVKRDYDDFAERLYNYISAMTELCGIRAVFFVNIKSWLTESERNEIYKLLKYNAALAVSIESFDLPKSDGEFKLIVDSDLCEIIA